ncbi:DUF1292 domain-containing protein [Gorillibacterium timonense]|uniref:DUF1292 domain-containing protein n=1 Tax=Gorillibacterium timonense TaxID=1689269 RepID=UPI00071DA43D|nr:DUF1292 domain-containing protein [Gorillibacterium timonense]
MTEYRVEEVRHISLVKDAFGDEIELEDAEGRGRIYVLLNEFSVGGTSYAIVQDDPMRREGEIDVFRIVSNPDGSLELESVEDDEEWENIAELYDEMTVSFED